MISEYVECLREGRDRPIRMDRRVCFYSHMIQGDPDVIPGTRDDTLQRACPTCPHFGGIELTVNKRRIEMAKPSIEARLEALAEAANTIIENIEVLQEELAGGGAVEPEAAADEPEPEVEAEAEKPARTRRQRRGPAPVSAAEPDDTEADEPEASDVQVPDNLEEVPRKEIMAIAAKMGIETVGVPKQDIIDMIREHKGGAVEAAPKAPKSSSSAPQRQRRRRSA